jgi:hypothetical protein
MQDPLYDLTNSDATLLSAYLTNSNSSANTSIDFEVPTNDGISLGFYKDTDSISTFRSTACSALKKKRDKNSTGTPQTKTSTPTQSVSFAPSIFSPKPNNTSMSRLSDTASKVAGLETRFEQMETQFTTSFARLEAMLFGLGSQRLPNTTGSLGSSQTPVRSTANPPTSVTAGGTISDSAAGQG